MFAYNAYKLEVFLWHKGRKYVYKVTIKYYKRSFIRKYRPVYIMVITSLFMCFNKVHSGY